jgi:hypothetical protein
MFRYSNVSFKPERNWAEGWFTQHRLEALRQQRFKPLPAGTKISTFYPLGKLWDRVKLPALPPTPPNLWDAINPHPETVRSTVSTAVRISKLLILTC